MEEERGGRVSGERDGWMKEKEGGRGGVKKTLMGRSMNLRRGMGKVGEE